MCALSPTFPSIALTDAETLVEALACYARAERLLDWASSLFEEAAGRHSARLAFASSVGGVDARTVTLAWMDAAPCVWFRRAGWSAPRRA